MKEELYPYQFELELIEEEIRRLNKKKRRKRRTITVQSYYDITTKDSRWLYWSGATLPKTTKHKTEWTCLVCGEKWLAPYMNIYHLRSGCPHCNAKRRGMLLVNDRKASHKQIDIANLISGIVNFPFGKLTLDVAIPEQK